MARYAATIFLSAFLLFQVQPLIGKRILPWFGGGPAVWTTCMLFFQVLLLAGYAYAHALRTWVGARREAVVHMAVLGGALAFLPIVPGAGWRPVGGEDPTWLILGLLTATVGLPYFVLASTSPLLQGWFSVTEPGRSPYRLYALSNAGSLLALLSYPFVAERVLSVSGQASAWSVGFGAFAVLTCVCAFRISRAGVQQAGTENDDGDEGEGGEGVVPSMGVRALWLGLAACGSVMLLAVTNQLCWDIAVVPFLWVLPLSVYLLTFIICFHNTDWYVRQVFGMLLLVAMGGMTWMLFVDVSVPILIQMLGYSAGLFVCCMVCHGELVRVKPGARWLTSFYLMVSAGGALGGVLVTLVAPCVFAGYWELHVGMWSCCALALAAWWRDGALIGPGRSPQVRVGLSAAGLLVVGWVLWFQAMQASGGAEQMSRSFYGVLRVVAQGDGGDEFGSLVLQHGRISHGCQFVSAKRRRQPTTYYGHDSGVGLALLNLPRGSGLRVGVVGLGAGTLAAYGTPGDRFRFYEINPEVKRLATTTFTYLADSEARCEVVLGDARLSLERERPQDFDLVALDAFTSGAIPVHLLTREAFAVYLRHLKPDGVLVVHVSNHYLDLLPVVRAAAAHFGLQWALVDSVADRAEQVDDASWVLMTRNQQFLESPAIKAASTPPSELSPRVAAWTDDYSNLLDLIE